MLRCETNTRTMERAVRAAFRTSVGQACRGGSRETSIYHKTQADFEHGQWWITCLNCGAQWSANDGANDGFVFEQVTQGEEA